MTSSSSSIVSALCLRIISLPSPQITCHRISSRLPLIAFPKHNHSALTTDSLSAAKQNQAQRRSTQRVKCEIEGSQVNSDDDFFGSYDYNDDGQDYKGRPGEKNFDRDPEYAEILGDCINDPQKARDKVEERVRKKRNKILHTKTGSDKPMKVTFNNFDFSNSYIWFEFYNGPLEKDIALICDTIRAWHIIGRLGGCNSMNMQLSQSTFERRPNYDAIQGANVNPTTFYNIGDFEIQDNLARIWVDIGTAEALILDVLINALTQISSDHIGIKQLVFGGSEFENWKDNL
ncbi:uncharacterized protein [Euphorbia lathyris]|uniref:uncharacterized protein n=1 Tax=Euphorbia lathyris TaxID=212925 RepID=UPI003313DAD1